MKSKRKFILLLLIVITSINIGCEDLNVSDPGNYNSANFPSTVKQLESQLVGVYSQQRSNSLYGFEYLSKVMFSLDHTTDLGFTDFNQWNEMQTNNVSASNSYGEGTWVQLYVGVQRSNTLLTSIENYRAKYMKDIEKSTVDLIEGEAHFLRAFYYFHLINLYGESFIINGAGGNAKGVPIIPIVKTIADTQVARSTVKEVWDYIIADLTKSTTLLEGQNWTGNSIARVSGVAAKSLLGKAYVFTQDWTNAKTVLKDVIDNSGKSLLPFSAYKNIFNGENEFSQESIYEINVERDLASAFGSFNDANITTAAGLVYAPTVMNDDGSARSFGFGNTFVHDKNLERFGFALPIFTLVDNPDFDSNSPVGIDNLEKVVDPNYEDQSNQLRTNQTVDPRLYVSALQPWIDQLSDGTRGRLVLRAKEIASNLQASYHGWSVKKLANLNGKLIEDFKATDNANIYFLRLADIYLLYAEACIETGETATGLEYINKIKRRAYGLSVNSVSPVDYASLTSPTKANDQSLANNPLRYERWAELFGEGQWWFDVCRWRIGDKEASYFQKTIPGEIKWSDAKSYKLPIPISEINTNTKMEQSNGY
jgi:starch-binding outer membrane protein, SusD/RagB family